MSTETDTTMFTSQKLINFRDLARTCPTCLLNRQFNENLLFQQAKISVKNFHVDFLGVITKLFPNKSFYTQVKVHRVVRPRNWPVSKRARFSIPQLSTFHGLKTCNVKVPLFLLFIRAR